MLKNEEQEIKTDPVGGRTSVGEDRVDGEGEGGRILWVYVVHVYKNRIMKSVRIVL
jgi:hypothetical protein